MAFSPPAEPCLEAEPPFWLNPLCKLAVRAERSGRSGGGAAAAERTRPREPRAGIARARQAQSPPAALCATGKGLFVTEFERILLFFPLVLMRSSGCSPGGRRGRRLSVLHLHHPPRASLPCRGAETVIFLLLILSALLLAEHDAKHTTF